MRSKRYSLALMPYWVLAIALSIGSQAASAARCDVDADRDIDRIDIVSIHQAVGSPASGGNDPRDGDGDGRILRNDELLCALRCTLPLCELVSGDGHANRRPRARNDSARTAENTSVRINVIANDRDPDGRLVAKSIKIVTRPKHGRVRNHRNGIVTYTPASGFTGQDRFRYRVRDNDHARSRAARVRIIVERGNHPPLADAGSDTNTTTALPVTLNGSGSSDPDGDALTFLWRFLSVPPPSTVTDASLANGNTAAPRFTPDVDGAYELALEASDGARSDVDTVIVTARAANVPPNANAGPDANAIAGQLVNLDGRGSADPDNGPAPPGFRWSFAAVPPGSLLSDINIAGASTALASFTPDFAGDYRISLDVDDGADTGRDEVLIAAALPNVAPNANAGADLVVQLGAGATLDGAASNDPDSAPTPLSFQWTFVNVPVDSLLTGVDLSGATTAAPSFTPDVEGFYLLRLDVSDGDLMDMDQVQVKANVAPVAVDDAFGVDEDTGLNAPAPGVVGNDSDGTSDTLTAVLNNDVSKGTLTLNPNGSFTYTPDTNFEGTDSFTYRANDGTVDSTNLATVTITVSAVDDPPVAVDDVATIDEDASATTITVLTNDTDIDLGAKTITAVQNPSANGGTVLITNGGADLTYQPAADYCIAPPGTTPDTFSYTLSPGGSTATVGVTVNCVDDPPVAANDTVTIDEDASATTIAVLANDPDLDGGAKTITVVQSPSTNGGTVTNGGTDLTYQPAADFCNAPPGTTPDTFTYTLSPGGSIATVGVTVNCVNDAPVIANLAGDTLAYTQGDPATPIDQGGDAAATDVDSPDFDTGTLTVSLPGGLVAAEDEIGIRNQGTAVNQIGVTGFDITFNPGSGAVIIGSFSGGGAGGGNLVVTLNTNANAAAVSALLRNITYVNSNTVAPDIANRSARFVLSDGDGGTSINYDTTITVTLNVPPTLDAIADPVAINEDASQQTTNLTGITAGGGESQPLQVTATSNNTDLIPNPTVTYTSPTTSGSLAYTPVANAFGTAIVTVTVTDGGPDGNLASAGDNGLFTRTFTVTVNAVNDPPTLDAIADPAAINEDAPQQTVNLAGISAGGGESQTLQVTATSDNTAVIPNPTVTYASPDPTGSLAYTPVANAFGTAIVTVTVTDPGLDDNLATPGDNLTVTSTFTVTVIEVNNPPTLDVIGDPVTINEDAGQQTVNLTGITAGSGETQPLQVTATSNNTGLIPDPTVTYTSPTTTGSLAYTPVANAFGTAIVTATVTDGGPDGNLASAGDNGTFSRMFTVTVDAVNDPPTLNAITDPAPINEDAPQQAVNLAGISAGGGESQTLQVTATSNNTGLIPNPTVTYGSPDPTGSLAYTPVANAFGTAIVTVTVTDPGLDNNFATPGDNLTVTSTFTVTVIEVNNPPTLDVIANPVAINEDASQQTTNLTGITAGSGETQPLQVTATSNNTSLIPNPTVTYTTPNTSGSLAYTPVPNAFGTALVTVTVTDGGLDDNLATAGDNGIFTRTFTVTVNPVNDAPSFVPGGNVTVLEDAGPQAFAWATGISAGPANETGQTLSFLVSNDNNALFSMQPAVSPTTGALSFTSALNANGSATVMVTLQDSGGTANGGVNSFGPLTFTITVNPLNDAPVAAAKDFTAQANMKVVGFTGFLSGVTDADTGTGSPACVPTPFTLASVSGTTPAGGTVTITNASTGTVDFDPPPGVTGNVTFTYTVSDNGCPGSADSLAATATVNVAGPVIWFVNSALAGPGDGRLSNPFKFLSGNAGANNDADDVDAANHNIFLFSSATTYTGGLTLNSGEKLIGQGVTGTTFDAVFGISPPAGTIARPTINGTRPSVGGTVTLASNSTVRGLNIVTSGATGLTGSAVTGVTVNEASVSATNATAVNFNGVGPGSAFTLTRVDSSNAANGIILNNNPTGSFTVTGTGAAGSGGTIQNTTARGASFISAQNISLTNMNFTNTASTDLDADNSGLSTGDNLTTNAAIHLETVFTATLNGININGSAEQGINGRNVKDFTLQNSSIPSAGNAADEDGIHFYNMLGTSSITNTTISSSGDDNINIQNNTNAALPAGMTAVLNLTITNGSANTGVLGSGYLMGIRGTSTATVTIDGVTANNNFSGGVVIDTFDTATSTIEVKNSTSTNNNDGISLSSNNGSTKFDIHDNVSFAGNDFLRISILKAAFSTGGTLQGKIRNNPLVVANGRPTDAISIFNAGAGALTVSVTGNDIDYAGTQRAILVQSGQDGSGSTNVTITGNPIDMQLDGAGNAVAGILAQTAITGPGNTSSLCADIGGAGALSNTFTHSLGGALAGGDIRVRQRNDGTARLPGYVGGATDTAAVIAYLNGRNTVVSASTATADSTGFAGGAACTQPAFP